MTDTQKIEKAVEYLHGRIKVYEEFMDNHIRIKGDQVSLGDFDQLTWDLLNGYSSEKELAKHILNILEKG